MPTNVHLVQMSTKWATFSYALNILISRGRFLAVLKNCFSYAKSDIGRFTIYIASHSFQISIASPCANVGMGDRKIKLIGQWKLDAFKIYIRLIILV